MLVTSNIQPAVIDIPMLHSLQATAISVEPYDLGTVIGAVYQTPSKPLLEGELDIRLSKSKKFIFGATSMRKRL